MNREPLRVVVAIASTVVAVQGHTRIAVEQRMSTPSRTCLHEAAGLAEKAQKSLMRRGDGNRITFRALRG
jgi:hypothetical protein